MSGTVDRPQREAQARTVSRLSLLDDFSCTGGACEDTCCAGWSIAVDPGRLALYRARAPELLDAVAQTPIGPAMRRSPENDRCVKLEGGACAIQRARGSAFQGDACHFFPRIVRRLGAQFRMSATMSCPEVARLALQGEHPFRHRRHRLDRLPGTVRDALPGGLEPEAAETMIDDFLALAGDPTARPERNMVRIANVALSLTRRAPGEWAEATPGLIDSVDERLLPPEPAPTDVHRLLLALAGLAHAARHPRSARFDATFAAIEAGLGVGFDWTSFALSAAPGAVDPDRASARLDALWHRAGPTLAPVLRRWLQAEIDASAFPFAGLGADPAQRATLLGVRFATLRLALMCHVAPDGTPPEAACVVRVAQSLARLLNHLADPELSLTIYRDAGWTREARLRGLLGDDDAETTRESADATRQDLPAGTAGEAEEAPRKALVA